MMYKRITNVILLIAAVSLFAGCGGKKKDTGANAGGGTGAAVTVSGRVDLYSGFGIALDRAGLADRLNKGTMVKLYRFTGNADELKPVAEVMGRPIDQSGSFQVENTPTGEANLVVNLESPDGAHILSVLLPVVPAEGLQNVVMSPETDLEVDVFKEVLRQSASNPLAKVTPAQMDSAFVKRAVTSALFFNATGEPVPGYAAPRIAAAIIAAQVAFAEDISGASRPVTDPNVQTILTQTREADMKSVLAEESEMLNSAPQTSRNAEVTSLLNDSIDAAGKKLTPVPSDISGSAIILLARERRMANFAACLSDKPPAICASPAAATGNMADYSSVMMKNSAGEKTTSDLISRLEMISGGNPAPAQMSATSTMPTMLGESAAIEDLGNLLNLSPKNIGPIREMLTSAENDLLDTDISMDKAASTARSDIDKAVNYALVGLLRVDYSIVRNLRNDLKSKSAPLAEKLTGAASMRDIASERKKFFSTVDDTLAPLAAQINTTYAGLKDEERKKLFYTAKMLLLASALPEIPSYLFHSGDTDGDGVPNDVEITLGTNPDKADSRPVMATARVPESMLPGPVADADSDGVPDIIEEMSGTDPNKAESKPDMDALVFCASEEKFPCRGGAASTVAKNEEPEVTVTGKVMYQNVPQTSITVALFRKPIFLNAAPAFASAGTTDVGGSFSVKAAAGAYFAVAFIDDNHDGKPGMKEAAGFIGAAHPAMLRIDRTMALPASVEMIGSIGGGACGAGQFAKPGTGECVKECPGGTNPDTLTGSCRCGSGQIFSIISLACQTSCDGGTAPDASGLHCECPTGATYDSQNHACVCTGGMSFNASAGTCECAQGLFTPSTGTCSQTCPATWVEDKDKKRCHCPIGTTADEASGMCACPGNKIMNAQTMECVASCPGGTVPDAHGKACVCPTNEIADGQGGCKCDDGFSRDEKSGKCLVPCPQGTTRDDTGNCVSPGGNDVKKSI